MATRSYVIFHNAAEGFYTGAYIHWSGAPLPGDWVGGILQDHYQDPAKIRKAIALGSCSILAADPGDEAHPFEAANDYADRGVSTYYRRDRGDAWDHTAPQWSGDLYPMLNTALEGMGCEYVYLWTDRGDGPQWYWAALCWGDVYDAESVLDWEPLGPHLAAVIAEEAARDQM
jgi:hypothetical protein